ncbi:ISAs1 family transposase [Streptomyces sp. B21-105]|uniref:ISAs1 family transposase n=1 Tax=Streptomyces sp. B21-105 TaxID=3039417 RepID=UPI002FF13A4B
MPGGGTEREQRRAHRAAARAEPVRLRRRTIAVDGKCLRGARRPDGNRVFVLSAVRHGDGVTLASREIGAKTNEIPEFAPLLDQIDDTDLAGVVVTADALHVQRDHATYLRERGAHYLLTIQNNQRGQARQLHALPWKEIPVIHHDDARGHGRHEQRLVQVVTVRGLRPGRFPGICPAPACHVKPTTVTAPLYREASSARGLTGVRHARQPRGPTAALWNNLHNGLGAPVADRIDFQLFEDGVGQAQADGEPLPVRLS